jgi:hypothetical protein
MPHVVTPLLTRLRRHRGLWLLAVAVILIKLVAGTICLADGSEKRFASSPAGTMVATLLNTADTKVPSDDVGTCLLGEMGDCHCACAHTMPLPATSPLPIARMGAHFELFAIHSGFAPAMTGSLLRPPIA